MAAVSTSPSRATIVDVARAAKVSRQTVSNVLNAPERVAPDTLERVRQEIARLGFTPNITAQQLRRRRATAYGFEVNPSGVGRMGHILDGFLVELTQNAPHHSSHLVTFAADPDDVVAGYRHLLDTGLVDGFVLADTRHGDPRPEWLLEHRVPFVSFGRIWDLPDIRRWVDVDGRAGVRSAVAHLVAQGYAPIGFLGWPEGSPVGDDRRHGWREGLEAAGLGTAAVAEQSVQDLDEATSAAERLIAQVGPNGGIVCASDMLALGVMRAVRAQGLEPGRDIGVVGFDDTDMAEALSLTSVQQPLRQAARTAWRLLLGEEDVDGVLLEPALTARASTARDSAPAPPTPRTNRSTPGTPRPGQHTAPMEETG